MRGRRFPPRRPNYGLPIGVPCPQPIVTLPAPIFYNAPSPTLAAGIQCVCPVNLGAPPAWSPPLQAAPAWSPPLQAAPAWAPPLQAAPSWSPPLQAAPLPFYTTGTFVSAPTLSAAPGWSGRVLRAADVTHDEFGNALPRGGRALGAMPSLSAPGASWSGSTLGSGNDQLVCICPANLGGAGGASWSP